MSNNRDLLKEAIADAKAVKETAIANAKAALEEAFTPHLKSMLAAKLEEMDKEDGEELEEMDAVSWAEKNGDSIDAAPGKVGQTTVQEEEVEEEINLDELLAELDLDEETETVNEAEEGSEDEAEEEGEAEEGEAEEEVEDEEIDLEDMTEDDLKSFIEDVIKGMVEAGELEAGEEAEDEGEEAGDEGEIEIEDETEDIMETEEVDEWGSGAAAGSFSGKAGDTSLGQDVVAAIKKVAAATGKSYDAISKALFGDEAFLTGGKGAQIQEEPINEWGSGAAAGNFSGSDEGTLDKAVVDAIKKIAAATGKTYDAISNALFGGKKSTPAEFGSFEESLAEIEALKQELQEVNLLNAKLLYTNKIFKAKNLSEDKKVKVLKAFDKAETVKEAKVIFETLNEGLVAKTTTMVNEIKGSASKATGIAPAVKQPIVENDAFARMQKLAGIIK